MIDLDNKVFIYKKTQIIKEAGLIYYYWYLIHKEARCGVHFHGCQYPEKYEYSIYCPWGGEHGQNKSRFSTKGIEIHSTTPLYEDQKPIDRYCDVTDGDCYCDGTSLMADRELGFIRPDGQDDEYIWLTLHKWYESNFSHTLEVTK